MNWQSPAVGKGEKDGGAVDARGFGGLLLEVVVGDVIKESCGAKRFAQLARDLEGVEVFAEDVALESESEYVGGGVLEAGTEEEADVSFFLHGVVEVSGILLTVNLTLGGGPNSGEKISQAEKVASEFTATASS